MDERPWHRHYDYSTPTTIRYPRLAVHDLLGIPANAYPDKAALNYFGTEMTFWELRLQVLRFANALGALGIQKGERVGIQLPNCPQYPIAYYAALVARGDRREPQSHVHGRRAQDDGARHGDDDAHHLRHGAPRRPRLVQRESRSQG